MSQKIEFVKGSGTKFKSTVVEWFIRVDKLTIIIAVELFTAYSYVFQTLTLFKTIYFVYEQYM